MRHSKSSEAPKVVPQSRTLHESPRSQTPEQCQKTSSPTSSLLVDNSPTAPSDTINEKRWKATFIQASEPSLEEADFWEELFEKVDQVVHPPKEAKKLEAPSTEVLSFTRPAWFNWQSIEQSNDTNDDEIED